MKLRNPKPVSGSTAFTLLELVVVLAILSVVTALAVRSLDGVQDQQRYEANNQVMQSIETAVTGSDPSGSGIIAAASFVADMGRLPKTVGTTELTLSELWSAGSLPLFDLRQSATDPEVYVGSGWRGPYLRLPIGASNLMDGWGNPIQSPADANPPDPTATGFARLCDLNGDPIITAGQPIAVIKHLGSNGQLSASDTGYAKDGQLDFRGLFEASVKATVDVIDSNGNPSMGSGTDFVLVQVFGPDPENGSNVLVLPTGAGMNDYVILDSYTKVYPDIVSSPDGIQGLTVGPRVVRAYLFDSGKNPITNAKSALKRVTLRPGLNQVNLTIVRS